MPGMQALLEIMARLRDPESGCPWDLEQDFSSISPHTIEEAYEVDEAIASGDLEALRDELGDLLFQVVFQARIAEERGAFDFEGVAEAIASKLIRRHPHVFGGAATPDTVEDQTANWESIKAAERASTGRAGRDEPDPFAGIPRSLPALARSAKLAGRLARVESNGEADPGAGPTSAFEVLEELSAAQRQAAKSLAAASGEETDRDAALRLVGEGLRSWVWLARELGVDAEQALRRVDDETIEAVLSNRHQAGNSQDR